MLSRFCPTCLLHMLGESLVDPRVHTHVFLLLSVLLGVSDNLVIILSSLMRSHVLHLTVIYVFPFVMYVFAFLDVSLLDYLFSVDLKQFLICCKCKFSVTLQFL